MAPGLPHRRARYAARTAPAATPAASGTHGAAGWLVATVAIASRASTGHSQREIWNIGTPNNAIWYYSIPHAEHGKMRLPSLTLCHNSTGSSLTTLTGICSPGLTKMPSYRIFSHIVVRPRTSSFILLSSSSSWNTNPISCLFVL
jgi:hypothetical protein